MKSIVGYFAAVTCQRRFDLIKALSKPLH